MGQLNRFSSPHPTRSARDEKTDPRCPDRRGRRPRRGRGELDGVGGHPVRDPVRRTPEGGRQGLQLRRDEQLLPVLPVPGDGRRRAEPGRRCEVPGAAHLGLERHRHPGRRPDGGQQAQRRVLPVLERHRTRLQRRRGRAGPAGLRDRQGRPARRTADHPVHQQLVRLRRHGPVRALGRAGQPRRLLHRQPDPGLVQGLHRAPAQPRQPADRPGLQERPDDRRVGVGQRAPVRWLRALPRLRRLHHRHAHLVGPRRVRLHPRRRPAPPGRRRRRGLLLHRPGEHRLDHQLRLRGRHQGTRRAARHRLPVLPPLPGRLGQGRGLGYGLDHPAQQRRQAVEEAGGAGRVRVPGQGHPQHRCTSSGPTPSSAAAVPACSTGCSPGSRTTARSTPTTTASPSTARPRSARRSPTWVPG